MSTFHIRKIAMQMKQLETASTKFLDVSTVGYFIVVRYEGVKLNSSVLLSLAKYLIVMKRPLFLFFFYNMVYMYFEPMIDDHREIDCYELLSALSSEITLFMCGKGITNGFVIRCKVVQTDSRITTYTYLTNAFGITMKQVIFDYIRRDDKKLTLTDLDIMSQSEIRDRMSSLDKPWESLPKDARSGLLLRNIQNKTIGARLAPSFNDIDGIMDKLFDSH